ncbi:hypothetical protein SAMN05444172_1996 [Burkholderia sp. GAS332]|nr:hypothetical protein SAMN05444172_1996 [Burkholderia sp. GAS332]
MSSGAPAALWPVPEGRPDKTRNCRTHGFTESRGSAGRLKLGYGLSLRLLRKSCEQTWAPQSRCLLRCMGPE